MGLAEMCCEKKCKKTPTYFEGEERVFLVRFYCISMTSFFSLSFNVADIFERPTKECEVFHIYPMAIMWETVSKRHSVFQLLEFDKYHL